MIENTSNFDEQFVFTKKNTRPFYWLNMVVFPPLPKKHTADRLRARKNEQRVAQWKRGETNKKPDRWRKLGGGNNQGFHGISLDYFFPY